MNTVIFNLESFRQMVTQYEKPLASFVLRMTGNLHDSQDLVQTTFMKALRALQEGDSPNNMRAWLYKIAYTTVLKHFRRRDVEKRALERVARDQVRSQENFASVKKLLLEEIMRLPDTLRGVAVLRFCQHLKIEEAAEVMDIPIGTAKVYVSRAVRELRRRMRSQFESGDLDTQGS